ncbi:MAG: terminase TerL endonuclease subunit [Chloroflexota bacterium]
MQAVNEYIDNVLSGELLACKWVKLACQRHLRDLKRADGVELWFDDDVAAHAIEFFQFLKHSKGEWAGRTLELEPWQQFVTAMIFGWQRIDEDGNQVRRFRTAYIEVPRKNGKTTWAAGLGLYLMDADDEPGAEIYTAATKRDQARISHSEATRMVKSSPFLRRHIKAFKDNLHCELTASKFEPVGRDADSLDGLNVHGAIVDEVHAHKTRDIWDILETATGARRQPLMIGITTAGFNRQSICFELHDYTEKVLEQVIDGDSFFGIIYSIDEDDDWEAPTTWQKANPNWGVSIKADNIRELAERAGQIPSQLNAFLRLRLNVWTQSETKWIDSERWQRCGQSVSEEGLRGRRCYAGLDLSTTTDVSAFVLVFPPEVAEDPYRITCRFWIPEDNMVIRSKRDRVPYDVWVRQGYMQSTPGDVIDYDFILAQIDQDAERYDLQEIAFDRWGATKLQTDMQEQGHEIVQFGQGFASMSGPMKELEKLILSEKIAHGGNPVLTWMAHNLVAREDPAGNIKPDKEKSIEKIDGMVALIMGLDRALRNLTEESVYEERDLRTL